MPCPSRQCVAAPVVGLVAGDPARSGTHRVALALGILAIYLVGVPWFVWNLAVFLPLDLLKAALLVPVIRVIRARGGLFPR